MPRHVYWTPDDEPGLEHARVTESAQGVEIDSWILRVVEGEPFRLRYRIRCDTAWAVRDVQLTLEDSPRRMLHLLSNGSGTWVDSNRKPLPHLDGCIDVDITATPFTNTLPIRRLKLRVGEAALIQVVYFTIPEMTISVEQQQYTCVETRSDVSVYEFVSVDGGFTALLPTDADGLVLDYPGLFRRAWSKVD